MRINYIILGLILFSQNLWAAAEIQQWQSKQGSPVYFIQTKSLPMVDIQVVFDAGSARDGSQFGIADFTSGMLDTGAGEWNADQIAQRFEGVGANFGSGVSRDMAWVSLRTLTQQDLFDEALETLHVVLTDPKFNTSDFEREKNRTLAGLKQREESPGAIAQINYFETLYGDHPYAHPGSGFIETVQKFTREDLQTFYRQYYVKANAHVILVGDLTREHAEQVAEQLLEGLSEGQKPAVIPKVNMPEQGVNEHIEFPSQQTHVLSGLPGMYREDPDYFPLYVGNHILGGSGLVSLLFKEVREKRGLAYSSYSYFSPLLRKGPFTMGLQTRNDQTGKAIEVMTETLVEFINDGPTEAQLLAAKKNITGGFAMRFDTNGKLTRYAAMIGFYDLPLDYLETFQGKVEAVTVEQIKDAFQRRIKPELLQTISVGASGQSPE